MVALNAGSRPLVDLKSDNKLEIVIQEIIQDKIYLDTSVNLKITGEMPVAPPVGRRPDFVQRLLRTRGNGDHDGRAYYLKVITFCLHRFMAGQQSAAGLLAYLRTAVFS